MHANKVRRGQKRRETIRFLVVYTVRARIKKARKARAPWSCPFRSSPADPQRPRWRAARRKHGGRVDRTSQADETCLHIEFSFRARARLCPLSGGGFALIRSPSPVAHGRVRSRRRHRQCQHAVTNVRRRTLLRDSDLLGIGHLISDTELKSKMVYIHVKRLTCTSAACVSAEL